MDAFGEEDAAPRQYVGGEGRLNLEGNGGGGEGDVWVAGEDVIDVLLGGGAVKIERHAIGWVGAVAIS